MTKLFDMLLNIFIDYSKGYFCNRTSIKFVVIEYYTYLYI